MSSDGTKETLVVMRVLAMERLMARPNTRAVCQVEDRLEEVDLALILPLKLIGPLKGLSMESMEEGAPREAVKRYNDADLTEFWRRMDPLSDDIRLAASVCECLSTLAAEEIVRRGLIAVPGAKSPPTEQGPEIKQ